MPTRSLPAIMIVLVSSGLAVTLIACGGSDAPNAGGVTTATPGASVPDAEEIDTDSDDDGPGQPSPESTDPGGDATGDGATDPTDRDVAADHLADEAVERLLGQGLSAPERECALARLRDETTLFERTVAAADRAEPIAIDDQADLVVIAFDCAPEAFAGAFSDAVSVESVELSAAVTDCFVQEIGPTNPAQRDVLVGLAALGSGQSAPEFAQGPVVDAMVRCFPGSFFGRLVTAEALANPALALALDVACVDTEFDEASMRPLWELLVQNPSLDFGALDPAATDPLIDAVFTCISFGRVVAAQASSTGIDISDATIDCIDRRLEGVDLVAELDATEGSSATRIAVIECLTPEEREAMGG